MSGGGGGARVLYERDGRIGRITLNRPEVLNAIDDELPAELEKAVRRADADPDVHVMVLSGNGRAFCAGYDLTLYAESPEPVEPADGPGGGRPQGGDQGGQGGRRPRGGRTGRGAQAVQEMPWDPIRDYSFMWRNTQHFMSLWRALKPVVCKVHGFAVAGGSDIALCADLVVMAETATIGYMPARVWGSPTTAMWVYRLGPERAKRMLFTGDTITGREAQAMGLVLQAVPDAGLDEAVEALAHRMASVPINQLAMQKLVVNQAIEATGLLNTQRLATIFDGITRHSPEGVHFKRRVEEVGWKRAVAERDAGTFDWTRNRPFDEPG